MSKRSKKAKSLVEVGNSVAINRRNIDLIQLTNNVNNPEYPNHYKITMSSGIFCEFDSKSDLKQVVEICNS